jgi:hypothetical protein
MMVVVVVADAEEAFGDETVNVAAFLIGITMRIEFGLDVRAFGPFPVLGFLLLFGFGLFHGEAPLFNGEAASAEVAAAKHDEVVAEIAEARDFEEFFAAGNDGAGEVEEFGEVPGLLHVFEGAGIIFGDEEVIAFFEAEAFAHIFEGVGVGPADADGFFGECADLFALGVEMVFGFDPIDLMKGEVLFEQGGGVELEEGEDGGHR